MTPELIKQWAEESGIRFNGQSFLALPAEIQAFAALVAAHQRELDAQICDEQAKEPECPERAQYCAAAIRGTK